MPLAKRAYVAAVRSVRPLVSGLGLLSVLERRGQSDTRARWARSLFAIHDVDDMVKLDLPWWTMDAIEKVDAYLSQHPGARVFEYGSGASTVWLSKRAASVTSIENDRGWFDVISRKIHGIQNIELMLVEPDAKPHPDARFASEKAGWRDKTFHDFVHAIDRLEGRFDVIVIDGRARPACLEHATPRLADDGLIVFDNTGRAAYRRAIAASPLRAERTTGLTACLPYSDETTLLTRAAA